MKKRDGVVVFQNVLLSLLFAVLVLLVLLVVGKPSFVSGSDDGVLEGAVEPSGLLADVVGEDALWKVLITQAALKWEIQHLRTYLAEDGMPKEGVLSAEILGRLQADQARLELSLKALRNEVESYRKLASENAQLKTVVADFTELKALVADPVDRDEGD